MQSTFSPAVSWVLRGEVKRAWKDSFCPLPLSGRAEFRVPADAPCWWTILITQTRTGFLVWHQNTFLRELLLAARAALSCGLQGWLSGGEAASLREASSEKEKQTAKTMMLCQCLSSSRTKESSFCLEIQTQNKGAFIIIDYKCRIVCSPPNFPFLFLHVFQITSQIHLHLSS